MCKENKPTLTSIFLVCHLLCGVNVIMRQSNQQASMKDRRVIKYTNQVLISWKTYKYIKSGFNKLIRNSKGKEQAKREERRVRIIYGKETKLFKELRTVAKRIVIETLSVSV